MGRDARAVPSAVRGHHRPRLPRVYVPRTLLWDRLDAATPNALTLLVGPMGSGKSLGVSGWLESRGDEEARWIAADGGWEPARVQEALLAAQDPEAPAPAPGRHRRRPPAAAGQRPADRRAAERGPRESSRPPGVAVGPAHHASRGRAARPLHGAPRGAAPSRRARLGHPRRRARTHRLRRGRPGRHRAHAGMVCGGGADRAEPGRDARPARGGTSPPRPGVPRRRRRRGGGVRLTSGPGPPPAAVRGQRGDRLRGHRPAPDR